MITTNRLPMSREQRRRLDGLIKQATDGLLLAAEERLNLDSDSRYALDAARFALAEFDYAVSHQPVAESL